MLTVVVTDITRFEPATASIEMPCKTQKQKRNIDYSAIIVIWLVVFMVIVLTREIGV